ncbi:hypothetical protein NMY22_g12081 [Coprinellus aureogranulatus]|nr:hypothetical protein NMY22_g12081 [Coprinellus aureogranulatus]
MRVGPPVLLFGPRLDVSSGCYLSKSLASPASHQGPGRAASTSDAGVTLFKPLVDLASSSPSDYPGTCSVEHWHRRQDRNTRRFRLRRSGRVVGSWEGAGIGPWVGLAGRRHGGAGTKGLLRLSGRRRRICPVPPGVISKLPFLSSNEWWTSAQAYVWIPTWRSTSPVALPLPHTHEFLSSVCLSSSQQPQRHPCIRHHLPNTLLFLAMPPTSRGLSPCMEASSYAFHFPFASVTASSQRTLTVSTSLSPTPFPSTLLCNPTALNGSFSRPSLPLSSTITTLRSPPSSLSITTGVAYTPCFPALFKLIHVRNSDEKGCPGEERGPQAVGVAARAFLDAHNIYYPHPGVDDASYTFFREGYLDACPPDNLELAQAKLERFSKTREGSDNVLGQHMLPKHWIWLLRTSGLARLDFTASSGWAATTPTSNGWLGQRNPQQQQQQHAMAQQQQQQRQQQEMMNSSLSKQNGMATIVRSHNLHRGQSSQVAVNPQGLMTSEHYQSTIRRKRASWDGRKV